MIFFLILFTASFSQALELRSLQGTARTEFRSPNGLTELCVVPKRWPGGSYRASDQTQEAQLCRLDFYGNVGICPKYSSTNPGVLMVKPDGRYDKHEIDSSDCNVDQMNLKVVAKFKQSLSCSNTSSILAYYQISRILGDAGHVPVAVIRTMDLEVHKDLTKKANRNFFFFSRDQIARTWRQYRAVHRHPERYPGIVDTSVTQIYGALSDNVQNEESYVEVSGTGGYESRYQRFMQLEPFLRVASSRSVAELVGCTKFTKVAPIVTQMKDVADMVVLDTLLNQQDRIGNIHFRLFWYVLNPEVPGQIERIKSQARWVGGHAVIPPEESREMQGRTAVLVKEMLLRDNDCGVTKNNMMARVGALERVRHISYLTYSQLVNFEKSLSSPQARNYFLKEMLFSPDQFQELKLNALKARQVLQGRCRAGQLRFDVDLADYVPGATPTTHSCHP